MLNNSPGTSCSLSEAWASMSPSPNRESAVCGRATVSPLIVTVPRRSRQCGRTVSAETATVAMELRKCLGFCGPIPDLISGIWTSRALKSHMTANAVIAFSPSSGEAS